MKTSTWSSIASVLGLAVLLTAWTPSRGNEPPPDPTPKDGVEVQARGPVHEAFAEPTDTRPEPTLVVAKQPPTAIDEVPPDEKPEGDNMQWLPGYWGWDDEQKDFLWISGFWRVPPPHRQWVPGNWQQVDGGWQWTPGFWAMDDLKELNYLPVPPPSIDRGPSTPAPDAESMYSPGCWVYRESRYLWRPGFWVQYQPDWVWIPAHYVWSPAGYVFVEGYWDRPLARRGLLFAPVRINRVGLAADWTYTPSYVVQPDFLLGALFVRPAYGHYYFGDYFEERYAKTYIPWIDFRVTKETIDPNFAYYRHRFHDDRDWERNLRGLYAGRISGDIPRPPRTLVQQTTIINNITVNKTQNTVVGKNINLTHVENVTVLTPVNRINNLHMTALSGLGSSKPEAGKREPFILRTEVVPKEQKAEVRQSVITFRETAQKRHAAEATVLAEGKAPVKADSDPPKIIKMELPKAPAPTAPARPDRPKPIDPPKRADAAQASRNGQSRHTSRPSNAGAAARRRAADERAAPQGAATAAREGATAQGAAAGAASLCEGAAAQGAAASSSAAAAQGASTGPASATEGAAA